MDEVKPTIDPEFQALIPPLSPAELQTLEQLIIADEGALDPITVWRNGDGDLLIVDGHNRFSICEKHGLSYELREKQFADRAEVKAWMIKHQSSRRNLSRWQVLVLHLGSDLEPPPNTTPADIKTAKQAIEAGMTDRIMSGELTLQMTRNRLQPKEVPQRVSDYTTSRRGLQRILVCPDAHHPFVDERAWNCFLGAVETVKPDVLVIIGDFCDSYRVSSHIKNPTVKLGLDEELDACNAALDQLTRLKIPRVVFCEGNHENRLQRYVAEKAPELFGIVPDMRGLLQIDRRPGWEWHPYKTFVRIGKMAFTHDVGRAGVNAMRQSLIDFGDNLVFGHTHRLGSYYGGTVDEDRHVCMNVGWLGDYNAIDYRHQFMARRDWQHGFGDITLTKDGVAYARPVPIIEGRCVIDGIEIAA